MSIPRQTQAYRVVIIDDQPEFLEFAREELSQSGRFTVVGLVQHSDQALSVIHDEKPDAVLLDVFMPGKSGFEIARQIQA